MSDKNKKVEVRYGSFTCSIEGYDNPVEQLREILGLMQNMITETPQLADQAGEFDPTNVEDALSGETERTPGIVVIRNADGADQHGQPDADVALAEEPGSSVVGQDPDPEDEDASDILVVDRPTDAMDTIDTEFVAEFQDGVVEANKDVEARADDESQQNVQLGDAADEIVAEQLGDDILPQPLEAAATDKEFEVGRPDQFSDEPLTDHASIEGVVADLSTAAQNASEEDVHSSGIEAETDTSDEGVIEWPQETDAADVPAEAGEYDNDVAEATDVDDRDVGSSVPDDVVDEDQDVFNTDQDHGSDADIENVAGDTDGADDPGSDSSGAGLAAAAAAAGFATAASGNFSSWGDRIAGFALSPDEPVDNASAAPSAFGSSDRAASTRDADDTAPEPSAVYDANETSAPYSSVSETEASADLEKSVDDNSEDVGNVDQASAADLADAGDTAPGDSSEDAPDTPSDPDDGGTVLNIFAAPTAPRGSVEPQTPVNIFAAAPARERVEQTEVLQPAAVQNTSPVVNIFGAAAAAQSAPDPEISTETDEAPQEVSDAAYLDALADAATTPEPLTSAAEGTMREIEMDPAMDASGHELDVHETKTQAMDAEALAVDTGDLSAPLDGLASASETPPTDISANRSSDAIPEIFGNMPDDIAAEFGRSEASTPTAESLPNQHDSESVQSEEEVQPAQAFHGDESSEPFMAEQDGSDPSVPTQDAPDVVEPELIEPEIVEAEIIEPEIVDPVRDFGNAPAATVDFEVLPPDDTPQEQPPSNTAFNIFAAPPSGQTPPPLQRFADSFSSDDTPTEPPVIDVTPETDPEAGPRPPWERPDGPMPDYSASARVRAGLDPFPKPAPKAETSTAVSGDVLSENAPQPSEAQSRFQALLQRVNSNAEDAGSTPNTAPPTKEVVDLSAAELAKRAGGDSTADLLAASAAWLTLYKNAPQFTRREVMKVFDTIPGDHPRTLEARIKGYGKLLRAGTIQLVDDGVFTMSPDVVGSFEALIHQS